MGFTDPPDVDLGDGRGLWFVRYGDVERWGAQHSHPDVRDPARECGGYVTFDGPEQRAADNMANRPRWVVESWEPLTLSPSLLCRTCGDHGFIRGGRWERA